MSTKKALCLCGGTGRRDRLKICFPLGSVGSSPTRGTKFNNRPNWDGFFIVFQEIVPVR